jgi:steroid 5-alpha reductase family enzyme
MGPSMQRLHVTGTRAKAFALCFLAYALALSAAIAVAGALRGLNPILTALCADIAATLIIYIFSCTFRNSSFYDPYWSVAPPAIAIYWAFGTGAAIAVTPRQIIVATLVFAWGLRLTYNWASRWRGLDHEDWRYSDLKTKAGKWFWLVDLVGIELMPTVLVFAGCLSLYPALTTGTRAFGTLDVVAAVVTTAAIVIEATADAQLEHFAKGEHHAGQIMDKGLWVYSRHPNYFGEVTFWWGLYIFALAADPGYWWAGAGPLAVTLLFVFISIPLMEKRNLGRRPGYEELQRRVPLFIPWFPKK